MTSPRSTKAGVSAGKVRMAAGDFGVWGWGGGWNLPQAFSSTWPVPVAGRAGRLGTAGAARGLSV